MSAPSGGEGKPSALSRGHAIHVDKSGLVIIVGGKWTTYRHMVEDCVDHAITLGGITETPCVTADLKIHGCHAEPKTLRTLGVYGSDAADSMTRWRAGPGPCCSMPARRSRSLPEWRPSWPPNSFSEVVGAFVLVIVVGAMTSKLVLGSGATAGLTPFLVGCLVWSIGLSLGTTTGYAINPARDFGPRLAHALLPIAGKGGSDWAYSWIPILGPVIGASLAGLVLLALGA